LLFSLVSSLFVYSRQFSLRSFLFCFIYLNFQSFLYFLIPLSLFLLSCLRLFFPYQLPLLIPSTPHFFLLFLHLFLFPVQSKTVRQNRPRKAPMKKLHNNRVSILSFYPEKKKYNSNSTVSRFPNISLCTHFKKHISSKIRYSHYHT